MIEGFIEEDCVQALEQIGYHLIPQAAMSGRVKEIVLLPGIHGQVKEVSRPIVRIVGAFVNALLASVPSL